MNPTLPQTIATAGSDMEINLEDFDDAIRKLEELEHRARGLNGTHTVPLSELMPPDFLRRHTRFDNVERMIGASGFEVHTAEDFEAIPEVAWDQFIRQNTDFSSWKDMLNAAVTEYTRKKLGF